MSVTSFSTITSSAWSCDGSGMVWGAQQEDLGVLGPKLTRCQTIWTCVGWSLIHGHQFVICRIWRIWGSTNIRPGQVRSCTVMIFEVFHSSTWQTGNKTNTGSCIQPPNTSFRPLIHDNVCKWWHNNVPFIILFCYNYSAAILGASFYVTMKLDTTACHFASCNEQAMKITQWSCFNQTVITCLKNWNVGTVISLFMNNFVPGSRPHM